VSLKKRFEELWMCCAIASEVAGEESAHFGLSAVLRKKKRARRAVPLRGKRRLGLGLLGLAA